MLYSDEEEVKQQLDELAVIEEVLFLHLQIIPICMVNYF